MSYILLYHNANVKPVMIGEKRSIILHDVMLLKVRRIGCAMNPAGKKNSPGEGGGLFINFVSVLFLTITLEFHNNDNALFHSSCLILTCPHIFHRDIYKLYQSTKS